MSASDYYPAGAYNDPNAPYNQDEPEEMEFVEEIGYFLTKSERIHSYDYICDSGIEYDDEGNRFGYEDVTYDGNVQEDYEAEYYTPCQMLKEYKMMLTERIVDALIKSKGRRTSYVKELQLKIASANGWQEEWY